MENERDGGGGTAFDGGELGIKTDRVDFARLFIVNAGLAIREGGNSATQLGDSVVELGNKLPYAGPEDNPTLRRAKLIGIKIQILTTTAAFSELIKKLEDVAVLVDEQAVNAFPPKESAT